MAHFVQIVEFESSRGDELRALVDQLRSHTDERQGPISGFVTEDRDKPGHYVSVLEFASYEEAMRNSARPEVDEFSRHMAALCVGPPRFINLELLEEWGRREAGAPA